MPAKAARTFKVCVNCVQGDIFFDKNKEKFAYSKKMLYLCSDFKSSLSSGPPSGERKNTLLQL